MSASGPGAADAPGPAAGSSEMDKHIGATEEFHASVVASKGSKAAADDAAVDVPSLAKDLDAAAAVSSSQAKGAENEDTTSHSAADTARHVAGRVLQFLKAQWFMIGLGVAVGFAAAVPDLGKAHGWIASEYSIKIPAIVTIFIISGIGLKTKVLLQAMASLRLHLMVQVMSLVAFPAIGYGVSLGLHAAGFNTWLAAGLVVMASMPTTVSTNVVYTEKAGGNEAAALVNAVIGNLIGIFITPLWLGLYLDVSGAAPYASVLAELGYLVIAPLVLGQVLQYALPKQVAWFKSRVNTANVSSFCILLLVWTTFCSTFASQRSGMASAGAGDVIAIVAINAALFFAVILLCGLASYPPLPAARRLLGLNRSDAVAVMICGSTKTVALGVPLINVMYGKVPYAGLLSAPLIIYHALQILLGGFLLMPMLKWVRAGEQQQEELPEVAPRAG